MRKSSERVLEQCCREDSRVRVLLERPSGSWIGEDVPGIIEEMTMNVRLDEICSLEKKKDCTLEK